MIRKTVVIGCGNGLCGDDAAGLAVADALKEHDLPEGVELVAAGMPGVGLLDLLAGYDRAVIVDAVVSDGEAGDVIHFHRDALETSQPRSSLHGFTVADALALGMVLYPERIPRLIDFVGIEIQPGQLCPGQEMSAVVKAAVNQAAAKVMRLIAKDRVKGVGPIA